VNADNWANYVQTVSTSSESKYKVTRFVAWLQEQAQEHNTEVLTSLTQVLPSRYPSQLIQALLEGLVVFIILNLIWLKPQKPGVITACFGVLYATTRIIGEQFRMPDSQIGFQAMGLTRGQWLSLAMFVGGVVLLLISLKSN
jgi:phosphatidylglycerol:prolipoprotein diacylglycerol transferase